MNNFEKKVYPSIRGENWRAGGEHDISVVANYSASYKKVEKFFHSSILWVVWNKFGDYLVKIAKVLRYLWACLQHTQTVWNLFQEGFQIFF